MAPEQSASERKRRGAWYTPPDLVERVVANTLDGWAPPNGPVRILDPACGDGRFLAAAARHLAARGLDGDLVGVDIDDAGLDAARLALASLASTSSSSRSSPRTRCTLLHADALGRDWGSARFDLVLGNPPFLSQMAAATTRGAASRHGGGPYADAAVEFLALAARLVGFGGRVGLVLPQSVLASRDAGPVRAEVERHCRRIWSWWSPSRVFEADVVVCALGFEAGATAGDEGGRPWTDVVTSSLGVPALPVLRTDGTLGERASLNANFRDEYYGMAPAVNDDGVGAPLVTSGLIDPGRCRWGDRPVRFARRRYAAPRVDVDGLVPWMQAWARRKLVPKVLVANQTRVLEAVADPDGAWLPGVPVTAVTPNQAGDVDMVWALAAVLTSPVASLWATHELAGTGLSPATLRLGPRIIGRLPWPAGDLTAAVAALRNGAVVPCGALVDQAYGVTDEAAGCWWIERLPARD